MIGKPAGSITLIEHPEQLNQDAILIETETLYNDPLKQVSQSERFTIQTTSTVNEEVREESDYTERLWIDGTMTWGCKIGDGWEEKWQTQEGDKSRFGTRRGRSKNKRWQERWEQKSGGVVRVEKQVIEDDSAGDESQRWLERLEIDKLNNVITDSRVGIDRATGRKWRSTERWDLIDGRRILKVKGFEEQIPDNFTRNIHQEFVPSDQTTKTVTRESHSNGTNIESIEWEGACSWWGERSGTDIDGSQWSETWQRDVKRYIKNTTKKCTTDSTVIVFDSNTVIPADGASRFTTVETVTKFDDNKSIQSEVVKGQKIIQHPDNVKHTECWNHTTEYNQSKQISSKKRGFNDYGDATEEWEEIWSGDGQLLSKSMIRDYVDVHSVDRYDLAANTEFHQIHDKTINQTDSWYVNEFGHRWGEKNGSNEQGIKWHEKWAESPEEKWYEKDWTDTNNRMWGELRGTKGSERWNENWWCDGKSVTRVRKEIDCQGNEIVKKEGKIYDGTDLIHRYVDNYGQTVAGEKWAYKEGFHVKDGEWLEKWNETPRRKSALKKGRNTEGDKWVEEWMKDLDESSPTGTSKLWARKEGENGQGDHWLEEWEESLGKKWTRKQGRRGEEEWQEEWGEEDNQKIKWTNKWAANGDKRWGQSWGDNWNSDEHWGKEWTDNLVINEWKY